MALQFTSGVSAMPVSTIAVSGASQALVAGIAYDITLTANCVLQLSGGVAGQVAQTLIRLRQGAGGPYAATWPSNALVANGQPPVLTQAQGRVDAFLVETWDASATVLVLPVGMNAQVVPAPPPPPPNLLQSPNDFTATVWTKGVATVLTPAAGTTPDGTAATRFQSPGASNGGIYQGVTAARSTLSCRMWAKSNTGVAQTAYTYDNGAHADHAIAIPVDWALVTFPVQDGSPTQYFNLYAAAATGPVDMLLAAAQMRLSYP